MTFPVRFPARRWFAVVLGVTLAACGKTAVRKEITHTRTVSGTARADQLDASSADRFGFASPHAQHAQPAAAPVMQQLEWDAPEGWQVTAPKPMREVNFQLSGSPEVECYVSILNSDGGGLEANVNRWRGQMGKPPLTADEIAALPTVTVLGKPAPLVEIAGSYRGMAGEAKPGYLLVGAICLLESRSVFVKITGPEAVVRPELDRFRAFCGSLRQGGDR